MDLTTIANLKPVLGYNITPQAVNELSLLGVTSITIPISGVVRLSQLPVDNIGNLNNMGNQTAVVTLSIVGVAATQITDTVGKTLAQVIAGLTAGQFFVIFGDVYFSVADEGKAITSLTYNSGGEIMRESDYNNALAAIQFLATQVPLQGNALTDYDPTQYPKRLLVLNSSPPGLYISDGTAWNPVSGSTLGFSVVRVKPNSVGLNSFVIQLSYNQGSSAPTIKRILDNGTAVDVTSSIVSDSGYVDDDLSSLSAGDHTIYYNISDATHVTGYNSSPLNISLAPPSGGVNVTAVGLSQFTANGSVNVPRTQSAVSIARIAWATSGQSFDQAVAAGQYIDLTTAEDITAFISSGGITKPGLFVGGTAYTFGVNVEETTGTGVTNWSGWSTGNQITAIDQPPAAVASSQIVISGISASGCTVSVTGSQPTDPDDLGATLTNILTVDGVQYGSPYTWAQLQAGVMISGQSWASGSSHTIGLEVQAVNGAKTEDSTITTVSFTPLPSDNFTGADGTALSSNWTKYSNKAMAGSQATIQSNKASFSVTSSDGTFASLGYEYAQSFDISGGKLKFSAELTKFANNASGVQKWCALNISSNHFSSTADGLSQNNIVQVIALDANSTPPGGLVTVRAKNSSGTYTQNGSNGAAIIVGESGITTAGVASCELILDNSGTTTVAELIYNGVSKGTFDLGFKLPNAVYVSIESGTKLTAAQTMTIDTFAVATA